MFSRLLLAGCLMLAVGGLAAQASASTPTGSQAAAGDVTSASSPRQQEMPTEPDRVRHVVVSGDTLSGVAARFDVRGGWKALYRENRRAIGPDPDVVLPGTALLVPVGGGAAARPQIHRVASGDTLSGVAARFDVRGGWKALYRANHHVVGQDPDVLRPGTLLTLHPAPAQPVRAERTSPPASSPVGMSVNASEAAQAARAAMAALAASTVQDAKALPAQQAREAGPGVRVGAHSAYDPTAYPGMPGWLEATLLGVGLLVLVSLVAEPARQRRREAATQTAGLIGGTQPSLSARALAPRRGVPPASEGRT
ncbi:MAG: LysM peptidoglycan-binding domain-containing protein [Actinomycetes bacterium]